MYSQTGINKKPNMHWYDYQEYESEPKLRNSDRSWELADELLDSGYFLKRRVWRNIKRIQKQYRRANVRSHPAAHERRKHTKFTPIHTNPLPRF